MKITSSYSYKLDEGQCWRFFQLLNVPKTHTHYIEFKKVLRQKSLLELGFLFNILDKVNIVIID
jgi:hypothetical protein